MNLLALGLLILGASTVDGILDRAQATIEERLDFDRGTVVLTRLLKRKDLRRTERERALELIARCHVAKGDHAAAVDTYVTLLWSKPEFTLDDWHSPKVRTAFVEAKSKWEQRRPSIRVAPPKVNGEKLILVGTVNDSTGRVSRVHVHHRSQADASFDEVEVAVIDGAFEAMIPSAPNVDYFVEARGTESQLYQTRGFADQPLRHSVTLATGRVEDAPRAAWYSSWWFWTAVGVTAAAGVTTAVVLSSGSDRDDLFELRLP